MFGDQRKIVDYQTKGDNENIKQTKIAVDFQAKFNRPITRQSISQVGVGEIVPCKCICINDCNLVIIELCKSMGSMPSMLLVDFSHMCTQGTLLQLGTLESRTSKDDIGQRRVDSETRCLVDS